jgi:lipoprotein-anchoring transpeptidase ErfK/SrfK
MTLREGGESGSDPVDATSELHGDTTLTAPSQDAAPAAAGRGGAQIRTVDVDATSSVQPTLGPARPAGGPGTAAGTTAVLTSVAPMLPPPPPWAMTAGAVTAATTDDDVVTPLVDQSPADPAAPLVAAVPETRSRRRRWIARTAIAAGTVVVLGASSVAVYDYVNRDVVLPGVTVEGRDVSGRSLDAAREEVDGIVAENAAKSVTLQVPGEADQPVTLGEFGLEADVDRAVDAVGAGGTDDGAPSTLQTVTGPFVRTYHRLTNTPVGAEVSIGYSFPEEKVQEFVAATAGRIDQPAVDAAIDVSSGQFVLNKEQAGRQLDTAKAAALIRDNASSWATSNASLAAMLPVETLNPAVTEQTLGTTLFVSRTANKMWHYNGSELVRTYNVSVGTSEHPTPRGTFKITHKRKNPTWINPAKGGWGSGMPARIGPGPDNPLGTRALNLNSSGIRIHGTKAVGRLGSPASKGCIRMAMPDVEEIFDRVEVDTRVIII